MDNYEYGYENESDPNLRHNRSIKGYQIIIILLAVILGALSFLYYNQMNTLKKEYAIERDTLQRRFSALVGEYDGLKTENDTISRNLDIQREKADSLIERLAKERTLNRETVRRYEKELGSLRSIMQTYVHQIDSLNTLNRQLITENVGYRQQITTERIRAERAEEKADELNVIINRGAVISVRDIKIVALNNNDREVTRASRAARLRVDFMLSANQIADPGPRAIYVRITGPDGYIMPNPNQAVFSHEGEMKTYSAMREVDYQNSDLGVSVFYNGAGITNGKYAVQIFVDGHLSGSTEVLLK